MITKQEEEKIISGACYALINPIEGIENDYTPELITNNYEQGEKVLTVLEEELQNCDAFYFSCAFITSGGITPLLSVLKELEKRNIPGKILTTDYLYFSQPQILDKLANMENIELKMFCCNDSGFHTKGYIFKKHAFYNIIVGSSNLTQDALTKNHEWNLQFTSYKKGALNKDMLDHFNHLWHHENSIPWNECKDEYLEKYKEEKKLVRFSKKITQKVLKPNKMQQAFTHNLRELVDQDENKALLISATGTGKLYPTRVMKNPKIDPKPSRSA